MTTQEASKELDVLLAEIIGAADDAQRYLGGWDVAGWPGHLRPEEVVERFKSLAGSYIGNRSESK